MYILPSGYIVNLVPRAFPCPCQIAKGKALGTRLAILC